VRSFQVKRIVVTEAGKPVLWPSLPDALVSELVYVLRRMTGAMK